jgi:hypothetical protein
MQLHADWAVTLGCGDACPYVPTTVEAWDITDPAGLPIEQVRAIRDEIELRARDLIDTRLDAIRTDPTAHRFRLARLLPQLDDEFEALRSPEEIRACADAILSEFDEAPVRGYVQVLAHRRTRECMRTDTCATRCVASSSEWRERDRDDVRQTSALRPVLADPRGAHDDADERQQDDDPDNGSDDPTPVENVGVADPQPRGEHDVADDRTCEPEQEREEPGLRSAEPAPHVRYQQPADRPGDEAQKQCSDHAIPPAATVPCSYPSSYTTGTDPRVPVTRRALPVTGWYRRA